MREWTKTVGGLLPESLPASPPGLHTVMEGTLPEQARTWASNKNHEPQNRERRQCHPYRSRNQKDQHLWVWTRRIVVVHMGGTVRPTPIANS
jgi:hypothetical protein